jgi:hypothetical protein
LFVQAAGDVSDELRVMLVSVVGWVSAVSFKVHKIKHIIKLQKGKVTVKGNKGKG